MAGAVFTSGCFGKDPLAADYLRHHGGGAAVLGFERWLESAVALAATQFGPRVGELLRALPVTFFYFPVREAGMFLVGAMRAGQDRSGRLFPMSVFLAANRGASWTAATIPLAFADFFERARRLLEERQDSLDTLFARVDELAALTSPADEGLSDVRALLSRYTWGEIDSPPQGFGGALLSAARTLRVVARRIGPGAPPGYGLRYPLPHRGARAPAACFWMALTARWMPAAREALMLWPALPGAATNHLDADFAGDDAHLFVHSLDGSFVSERLFALHESTRREGEGQGSGGLARALADADTTLVQLLDAAATDEV